MSDNPAFQLPNKLDVMLPGNISVEFEKVRSTKKKYQTLRFKVSQGTLSQGNAEKRFEKSVSINASMSELYRVYLFFGRNPICNIQKFKMLRSDPKEVLFAEYADEISKGVKFTTEGNNTKLNWFLEPTYAIQVAGMALSSIAENMGVETSTADRLICQWIGKPNKSAQVN